MNKEEGGLSDRGDSMAKKRPQKDEEERGAKQRRQTFASPRNDSMQNCSS